MPSIIRDKSFNFALKAIKLYQQLISDKEFVISKQLLKSATSIGANVEEALAGQSKKDFIHKMSIASKEARETKYWLQLLHESKITSIQVTPMLNDIDEIIKILTAIIKTSTESNRK